MRTSSDTMAGAGGVRLAVTRWTPEVPAVAAVLLVHGYGEHSGRYEPVAQRLTAAGYAVTTFDLRGHGRSTGVARGTVDDFDLLVDDVATVARSVEGGGDLPLFVYGHSMGGLAVVRLAEKAAAGTVDVPPIAGLVVASAALVAAESIPAPLVAVANVIGKLAPKLPTIRLDGEAISPRPGGALRLRRGPAQLPRQAERWDGPTDEPGHGGGDGPGAHDHVPGAGDPRRRRPADGGRRVTALGGDARFGRRHAAGVARRLSRAPP